MPERIEADPMIRLKRGSQGFKHLGSRIEVPNDSLEAIIESKLKNYDWPTVARELIEKFFPMPRS